MKTKDEVIKQAKQATPHKVLIDELLSPSIPKNEREHAAAREIEKLRAALAEQPETKAGELSAMRTELWKQPKQDSEPHHWIVPEFAFLFPSKNAAKDYLKKINSKATPTACYTAPKTKQDSEQEADEDLIREAYLCLCYLRNQIKDIKNLKAFLSEGTLKKLAERLGV